MCPPCYGENLLKKSSRWVSVSRMLYRMWVVGGEVAPTHSSLETWQIPEYYIKSKYVLVMGGLVDGGCACACDKLANQWER